MSTFVKACYGADGPEQSKWRRRVDALVKQGVTSEVTLIEKFASLDSRHRITAIWVAERLGKKRFVPLLLQALEQDRSAIVRGQVGVVISSIRGKKALRGLLQLAAKPGLKLHTRKNVAYTLAFLFEDGALDYFVTSFANKAEDPQIRSLCAEGIANLLAGSDRRTAVWRQTVGVLLPGLADDNSEVRFWSIFALGQLRAKVALPTLRKLIKTDAAVMSSMGWEVGEEARDAIAWILGKRLKKDAYERAQAALVL